MSARLKVAFLSPGRQEPADGVHDNLTRLLACLNDESGVSARLIVADWRTVGWRSALRWVRESLQQEPAEWVVLEYTHFMWSRRGLPIRALFVAAGVRRQARLAVHLHDPSGATGKRQRDRIRRRVQHGCLRWIVRGAERSFVTVPPECLEWTRPADSQKLQLLPATSSFAPPKPTTQQAGTHPYTVVVFGVTEDRPMDEVLPITEALRLASRELGVLRLIVLGRGSAEASAMLCAALEGTRVHVEVHGIVDAATVAHLLRRSDVMLFVRGEVSSRRSSVIAGLAFGLPVVGYRGRETAWPMTDAGVLLTGAGDVSGLASSIVALARDSSYAAEVRRRSARAYEDHFSWSVLASTLRESLPGRGTSVGR